MPDLELHKGEYVGYVVAESDTEVSAHVNKEGDGGFSVELPSKSFTDLEEAKQYVEDFMSKNARQARRAQYTQMSLDDLISEHENLVKILESPSHEDDLEEAKEQKKELEEYINEKKQAQSEADEDPTYIEAGDYFQDNLVDEFPGFLTDSDVNGGDLVDWVAGSLGESWAQGSPLAQAIKDAFVGFSDDSDVNGGDLVDFIGRYLDKLHRGASNEEETSHEAKLANFERVAGQVWAAETPAGRVVIEPLPKGGYMGSFYKAGSNRVNLTFGAPSLARVMKMASSDTYLKAKSYGDVEGIEPAAKDIDRMESMKEKSGGDEQKVLQHAFNMAQAIQDSDKALRRGKAAEKVFGGSLGDQVAKIFEDRAKEIDG